MLPAGAVIPIDKPTQWTSFQVVNKIKWLLCHSLGIKKIKIGHAGTLDPLASGLLLVCVGKATKQIAQLQDGTKEYSGTMVLGATTPCFDLERPIDKTFPVDHITSQAIDSARQQFIGDIEQVPPSFSAVKVDGQRAYSSARDGEMPLIAPKKVAIYDFQVSALRVSQGSTNPESPENPENPESPESPESTPPPPKKHLYRNPQGHIPPGLLLLDFHVTCGKGTYIRSLARDFGAALGSGAFLGSLRRTRIGDYHVSQALPLIGIEQLLTPENPSFSDFFSSLSPSQRH